MKHLLYILNIIIAVLVFASCKDENSVMPGDDEPCYTILVSAQDAADTRAYYKEDGSDISVVWEKGDVVYVGTNEFVFKEMDGNNGLFYHYGALVGETSKVTFGFSPDDSYDQIQKKNNICREVLEGTVPTDYKFTSSESPIPLLPSENKSLIHIQTKSPAMFLGGSLLKIKGLAQQDYNITLGDIPEHVFADEGDELDIYVVVPSNLVINSGSTLKLFFYAYDENESNVTDGDEYHYYMKCNSGFSTANNEVVKMKLPNRPTHAAIQLGLPSGIKWATTNVGATSETEYGKYFAWGSTDGYDINTTHDFNKEGNNDDTWDVPLATLKASGILGADYQLTAERDAAIQSWGTNWRMPSRADFGELRNTNNCTWTQTTVNSVNGYKVTSKTNGKSIFFPFAGFRDGTGKTGFDKAFYRTTSLSKRGSKWAYGVMMTGTAVSDHEDGNRYTGLPIRPVLANGATVEAPKDIEGSLSGEFSITSTKKVKFSKGILQYQASTGIWRFADQQYDAIVYGNDNISSTYDGWIDLFGWGTSGWSSGAKCYQPYSTTGDSTNYYVGNNWKNDLTGNYRNADWGVYNAISNGGNQAGLWRTLTYAEMKYLIDSRKVKINNVEKKCYTKATLKTGTNDLPVILFFPDGLEKPDDVALEMGIKTDYTTNTITLEQLKVLEFWGVVMFAPTGFRKFINGRAVTIQYGWKKTDYEYDTFVGCYWLSTHSNDPAFNALNVRFGNDSKANIEADFISPNGKGGWRRHTGHAVRLVHEVK